MSEKEGTKTTASTGEKKKKTPQKAEKEKSKVKTTWSLEKCSRIARRFSDENEWAAGAPSSYKSAKARGWVEACLNKASTKTTTQKNPKKAG